MCGGAAVNHLFNLNSALLFCCFNGNSKLQTTKYTRLSVLNWSAPEGLCYNLLWCGDLAAYEEFRPHSAHIGRKQCMCLLGCVSVRVHTFSSTTLHTTQTCFIPASDMFQLSVYPSTPVAFPGSFTIYHECVCHDDSRCCWWCTLTTWGKVLLTLQLVSRHHHLKHSNLL